MTNIDIEINATASPINLGDIELTGKDIEISISPQKPADVGTVNTQKDAIEVDITTAQPIEIKDVEVVNSIKIEELIIGTTAQGPKGQDGLTPYIGPNGNWFIGNIDTGVSATAYPEEYNSFSYISINDGQHTIVADQTTDTLNIKAGKNINIDANINNDSITINAVDSYTHEQMRSSDRWVINHNLGKFPSVTVVDTTGSVVVGDINYTSLNQLIISFVAEFSGKAYLN